MRDGGIRSVFSGIVERWVVLAVRFAPWVVLASLLVAVPLAVFTVRNLGVNTDTADMISEKLPWRQDYLEYKKAFPQYFEEIVAVVEGDTPELADAAAGGLAGRLASDDLVRDVYYPGGEEFFRTNGLLYLTTDELTDLADRLADVQPFLGRLARDRSLTGLVEMLEEAMEEVTEGEDFDLTPVFDELAGAFSAAADGRFHRVSWREMIFDEGDGGGPPYRRFVIVKPEIDFTGIQGAEAIKRIREVTGELGIGPDRGTRVRLTGSVAVAHDELRSVARGTEAAGAAALVLVALILYVGMRSVRLMAASVYTLVFGLLATAAFAAFAVGELNLITVAFAVLYIGLGIDYAIHLSLRYRELIEAGEDHEGAMRGAARDVGSSLVMCALTTAAGFYAFVPTAYSGVSELGVISGTGMIISLVVNLTVLPAALSLAPLRKKGGGEGGGLGLGSFSPARHRKVVWAVTAVAFAASLALLSQVRFNYDPMELRDPETESVATYYDLMKTDNPPLSAVVLEKSLAGAVETARSLESVPEVDRAVTVADFVPDNQDEKLGIIGEMGFLLGPELIYTGGEAPERAPDEVMKTLEGLEDALGIFVDEGPQGQKNAAGRMFGPVKRFLDTTERLGPAELAERLERLETDATWAIGPLLDDLAASLEAGPVTLDGLPEGLKGRWVSPGGLYRVEATPAVDVTTDEGLRRFVAGVRSAAPAATGAPVFFVEAAETVIEAFARAVAYALVLISVILLVITGSPLRTVLVLTPMLLAGLFTAAATVLAGVELNFANTIALPLILGIGVDNGIHMVRRAGKLGKMEGGGGGGLLSTSTARAVLLSALTTTVSFGGLAFSSHPGTASIGWLLALGVVLTLATTLVVLPTLVRSGDRGKGGG